MLAFAKLLMTFSISMYIMCVILCLFSALSRGVGALQISIIITKMTGYTDAVETIGYASRILAMSAALCRGLQSLEIESERL